MTIRNFYPLAWALTLMCADLTAQTVTLGFRPPSGAVVQIDRERAISTVTRQTSEFDVEKTISLMAFEECSEGYRVSETAKQMSRTVDGKPIDNPAHKFLVGRTNAFIVLPDGDFLRLEGQERLLDELKAFFPTHAHALLEKQMGGEQPFLQEKERWDRNMKRFVGRMLKDGDVWKETVSLPTASNAAPRKTYEVNRVEKIDNFGPTTTVTIVTFRSSNPKDIEELDAIKINMKNGPSFYRRSPFRPPFTRVVQRRTLEADTLIPIHDERIWHGSERKQTEWAIITERQVESYRRVK